MYVYVVRLGEVGWSRGRVQGAGADRSSPSNHTASSKAPDDEADSLLTCIVCMEHQVAARMHYARASRTLPGADTALALAADARADALPALFPLPFVRKAPEPVPSLQPKDRNNLAHLCVKPRLTGPVVF